MLSLFNQIDGIKPEQRECKKETETIEGNVRTFCKNHRRVETEGIATQSKSLVSAKIIEELRLKGINKLKSEM